MRITLILLFLLITELAFGQQPSKSDCAIIVNKEWYVAGDTVWFKVFLPLTFDYQNSILKAILLKNKVFFKGFTIYFY